MRDRRRPRPCCCWDKVDRVIEMFFFVPGRLSRLPVLMVSKVVTSLFVLCRHSSPFCLEPWRLRLLLSCRASLALVLCPPSIILTAARSLLLACCSVLWQETFLLLLYGLLTHYCTTPVTELTFHSLPSFASSIQSVFVRVDVFWWQWRIFMTMLISSHFCFFSPHLPGRHLQENELYNTIEGTDSLQSTSGQFAPAWLGLCLQPAVLKTTCQHPFTFLCFFLYLC